MWLLVDRCNGAICRKPEKSRTDCLTVYVLLTPLLQALHALRSGQLSEGSGAEPLSDKMDALSWRYECSSMAVAEAARLKETVKALEKSLDETASQLASVKAEFEAVNFALAEKKEE